MLVWGSKRRPSAPAPDQRTQRRSADKAGAEAFLAFLIDTGRLDASGTERARAAFETLSSMPLVLTELGLLSEADLVAAEAAFSGLDPVAADALPTSAAMTGLFPADYCRRVRILPLKDGALAEIAVVDPFQPDLLSGISYALGGRARFSLIGPGAFEDAARALYGERRAADEEEDAGEATIGGDTERLEDAARQAPIIRLANTLLRIAFELGASDIHVEPGEHDLVARFRVDGVLVRPEAMPRTAHTGLVTRIKILASLNIAERRLPQDGRMKVVDRGREVDVRVSVLPTSHGEALVLRLLGQSRSEGGYADLGFSEDLAAGIERMTKRPNGIFLVTGPTGSGKTTTLYTLLGRLNDRTSKIVTVEDPVEYRVPGVTQVQTHAAIGLDFATALRSILRQDPDVVMIGEIRDGETARIAVQAALTGHLVVSTLHTNSAASAVTRLVDMGVEPYLLSAVLNGVLAQRLLRCLCRDCRVVEAATQAERVVIARHRPDLEDVPPLLAHARGCPACNGTGFRGRTVIAEGLDVDAAIAALVASGTDERAIEAAAMAGGMRSLVDHGIEKVLAHETSLDEMLRHLGPGWMS